MTAALLERDIELEVTDPDEPELVHQVCTECYAVDQGIRALCGADKGRAAGEFDLVVLPPCDPCDLISECPRCGLMFRPK